MKKSFVLGFSAIILQTSFVWAQFSTDHTPTTSTPASNTPSQSGSNSAYNSASSDKGVQTFTGVVGVAMGGYLAKTNCSTAATGMTLAFCVMGIGTALESLATLSQVNGNTGGAMAGLCSDPTSCSGSGGGSSDPSFSANLKNSGLQNTPYASDLQNLQDAAKNVGLDLNNPQAVQDFLSKNGGGAGGSGTGFDSLTPQQQDTIDQAKKYANAKIQKYGVSSVGFESSGAGGMALLGKKNNKNSEFDLDSLMDKMDLSNKKAVSNQGLSRNLASGEPIGIASDNIFNIVSRRYQSKIQSRTFLK